MKTLAIIPLPGNLETDTATEKALREVAHGASDIALIFTGHLPQHTNAKEGFKAFQSFLISIYHLLVNSRQDKSEWWGGNIDVWFDAFWDADWMHTARLSQWDVLYSTPAILNSAKGSNIDDIPSKRVIDGLQGPEEVSSSATSQRRQGVLQTVALGGTFDHLHAGHKVLLTLAVYLSTKRVVIGVSGPALLTRKNNPETLESIHARQAAVDAFVRRLAPTLDYDIFALDDVYGPTATDADIDGIVVSTETLSGSEAINSKRKENKIKELDVFVINLVDQTAELKLSSSEIRRYLSKADE
ncbi:hypothetical protein E3P99_03511 [Wallemia hederae]|uniref:Cytidyltransferase-like domain-containing protein n=1 Tax=Wallemia hederae TaxID=1540922 RepID=A0A4T0FFZ9_9BASI|nr:hypothetical protein E3P99_03511 [Wallemia hederae]